MGLFLKKNHLLRRWGCLYLVYWIGALTLPVVKTASKKSGALIRSMKFLSAKVDLYLYKSTIQPCHDWVAVPNYYLDILLVKLQKQVCSTVGS